MAIEASASLELKSRVERAFAFSASSERLSYITVDSNVSADDIIEKSPSRVLFVQCRPNRSQLSALKYLDVPWARFKATSKDDAQLVNPEFTQRGRVNEVVGRRNSVYVHKPTKRNLPIVVSAFLEAKRQYPDLLLMLSGITWIEIEALGLQLNIIEENSNKSKRQLGDVLIAQEEDFKDEWVACANLCILLPENKDITRCAFTTLGSGASLLTYRVDLEAYEELAELEAIGAIWSAQRPNLLAAAMTQALSPEKTALTVVQSLEHITAMEDEIGEAIDALLDRK